MRTTTGIDICGRCQRVGHKQNECARKNMQCRRCQRMGHISPECRVTTQSQPRRNGQVDFNNNRRPMNQGFPNNNVMPPRPPPVCYRCGQPGHLSNVCNQVMSKSNTSQNQQSVPRFEEVPPLNK